MHTFTLTFGLLGALAATAPTLEMRSGDQQLSENIDICDFLVRKSFVDGVESVALATFKLNGNDADGLECTTQNPSFPDPIEVATCGDSLYSFSLQAGDEDNEFALQIYHDLEPG